MSLRSKKKRRWRKRLEEAHNAQQQFLALQIAEIRRVYLHNCPNFIRFVSAAQEAIDNLIVYEPSALIFRAMKRAKKGKRDPVLGDSYLLKK